MTYSTAIRIEKTVNNLIRLRQNLKGTVGFIPTMGYLHDGHLSLVELAKKENDNVVISIFVNPKQFESEKDLKKYPRNIKRDIALLRKANVSFVFIPKASELYPEDYETYVSIEKLSNKLEGKIRPGHFTGVATVITKLFNIIQPDRAYFGQKDAQQVVVIKKIIEDLNIPIRIVVGKTIRELDGLAMSSRNVFLSKDDRKQASIIYKSLSIAKLLFDSGEKNSKKIKLEMTRLIHTTSGEIEYISIADTKTLNELGNIKNKAIISVAVRYGRARLIDNIILGKK